MKPPDTKMEIKHSVFVSVSCCSCSCFVCCDCPGASLNSRSGVRTVGGSADKERTAAAAAVVVVLFRFIHPEERWSALLLCVCVCASLRLLHCVGENKGVLALAGPDCSH